MILEMGRLFFTPMLAIECPRWVGKCWVLCKPKGRNPCLQPVQEICSLTTIFYIPNEQIIQFFSEWINGKLYIWLFSPFTSKIQLCVIQLKTILYAKCHITLLVAINIFLLTMLCAYNTPSLRPRLGIFCSHFPDKMPLCQFRHGVIKWAMSKYVFFFLDIRKHGEQWFHKLISKILFTITPCILY